MKLFQKLKLIPIFLLISITFDGHAMVRYGERIHPPNCVCLEEKPDLSDIITTYYDYKRKLGPDGAAEHIKQLDWSRVIAETGDHCLRSGLLNAIPLYADRSPSETYVPIKFRLSPGGRFAATGIVDTSKNKSKFFVWEDGNSHAGQIELEKAHYQEGEMFPDGWCEHLQLKAISDPN